MFESIQFLFDFLAVFYNKLSLLDILLGVVKYAALGFVVGLILMIVCAKRKFFKRQNKYWNIFAKLYYVYILIVCIGGGVALSLVQSLKELNNTVVSTVLAPLNQEVISSLQNLSPEVRDNLSVSSLKGIIKSNITQRFKDTTAADNPEAVTSKESNSFISRISDSAANAAVDKLNEKIAGTTGMEKESVNKLWKQNLVETFEGGFLNDFVSQLLNKKINELQNTLLLFLAFLMAIPAVDTLVAKWLEKRNAGPSHPVQGNGDI